MNALRRFTQRYRGHLLHIWLEEPLGWFVRSLPGFSGMAARWYIYRFLFKKLDSFCLIYPGAYFTHTYGLSVGRFFSINSGAMIDARGGVQIGDHVMIGPHSVIVSSNHDIRDTDGPMAEKDHIMKPVVIGSDVWIGAHAVILGGIKVGNRSIISAGAIVTRDVGDNEIVGGVPAKLIGMRNM